MYACLPQHALHHSSQHVTCETGFVPYVLVQIRTQATLVKLYEWVHALTSHTQRALHTVEPSDNEMTLALSRALEVLSRLSELTDTKLQYS